METMEKSRTGPLAVQARRKMELQSDQELARAARSDMLAFSELYRRHFRRVYGYHLLRTSNIDDAQDLTSQTFLAALEGIQRYNERGSFAAWLMSIAHNQMAQHYRRKRPESGLEAGEDLPNPRHNPEDLAYQRGLMHQVRKALGRISPERAEAFALRVFGKLSAAETAEVLGKQEGAVKMLVHRALVDLRQMLDGALHLEEE